MWRRGLTERYSTATVLRGLTQQAPARGGREQGVSSLAWGARLDDKSVNASLHLRLQGIINEAMSSHPIQPGKAFTDQTNSVVTALASTGVPGMQVAVVLKHELGGLQRHPQGRFDALRKLAHG